MSRLADGRVGFAEGAFPGDTIEPLEIVEKKDYARAARFRLVEASAERAVAVCPVVDACGACDWMKLARGAELRHKGSIVREAFERTGRVHLPVAPQVITAGDELGYRSRVRLHVDEQGKVGFYARGTHTLVEVPGCPVAEPEVERGISLVRSLANEHPVEMASFESVEVRATDGRLEFALRSRTPRTTQRGPAAPGSATGLLLARLREQGSATIARGGGEFSQVNRAANAVLVERVVQGALARGVGTFLDLYAGSGNFSVPLARAGLAGVSVESDGRSAARAKALGAREAPGMLEVLTADVAKALTELSRTKRRFDLAVLDPPRSGAKNAMSGLAALGPRTIAYVACDPVTLARDVRLLGEKGWDVLEVTCFDMFPKTHHVETLVWLARRERV